MPWTVQLLVSFVEEGSKLVALTAGPSSRDAPAAAAAEAALLSSWQSQARSGAAVVVVAAAVSWLLEVLHLVSYTRHVRALRAQKRASKPACNHSSASSSKAPAQGCCNNDQ